MPQMATIGIDCRFASTHSGLGRYTREITKALLEQGAHDYVLFVRSADEEWLQDFPRPHGIIQAPFAHYSIAEQRHFPVILKHSGIDLLFSPHFNVPIRCPVPYVVTIHDLILHAYPNQVSLLKRFAYRFLISHAVSKAQSVITISQFVKGELLQHYPSIESKLTVITEGVTENFHKRTPDEIQAVLKKHDIASPYFLYVGNAKQHKNVQTLIDAYAASGRTDSSLVLVTGGKEANSLRLPDSVRRVESIDDADLPSLYSGALCFVTASLYEGFGLPVLEAQACECPVIASNKTAIPEAGGNNAVYCEPTVESLSAALQNPPKASTDCRRPTWEDAARETAKVLH